MPMTSQDFMRAFPVPDQERMATIRDHVHHLASARASSDLYPSERMLLDLYRGYSEVVKLFVQQFGYDPGV